MITTPTGIYFDKERSDWVDCETGIVLDGPGNAVASMTGEVLESFSPDWQSWCGQVLELIERARFYTQETLWVQPEVNPDLQVGHTSSWSHHGYEEVGNPTDKLVLEVNKKGQEVYRLVRDEILQVIPLNPASCKRIPDVCNMDSTASQVPEIDLPKIKEPFEALYKLIGSLRSTPNAKWAKWISPLCDFLIDHINVVDRSGEISIPDLLSAFTQLRKEKAVWLKICQMQHEENKQLRLKMQHLRRKLYK